MHKHLDFLNINAGIPGAPLLISSALYAGIERKNLRMILEILKNNLHRSLTCKLISAIFWFLIVNACQAKNNHLYKRTIYEFFFQKETGIQKLIAFFSWNNMIYIQNT